MLRYKDKEFICPIEYALAVIGGKWSGVMESKRPGHSGSLNFFCPMTDIKPRIRNLVPPAARSVPLKAILGFFE